MPGYPARSEEGGLHRYAVASSCCYRLCSGVQNHRGVLSGSPEKLNGETCSKSNNENQLDSVTPLWQQISRLLAAFLPLRNFGLSGRSPSVLGRRAIRVIW